MNSSVLLDWQLGLTVLIFNKIDAKASSILTISFLAHRLWNSFPISYFPTIYNVHNLNTSSIVIPWFLEPVSFIVRFSIIATNLFLFSVTLCNQLRPSNIIVLLEMKGDKMWIKQKITCLVSLSECFFSHLSLVDLPSDFFASLSSIIFKI